MIFKVTVLNTFINRYVYLLKKTADKIIFYSYYKFLEKMEMNVDNEGKNNK